MGKQKGSCNPLGVGLQLNNAWQIGYHVSQSRNSSSKSSFHLLEFYTANIAPLLTWFL